MKHTHSQWETAGQQKKAEFLLQSAVSESGMTDEQLSVIANQSAVKDELYKQKVLHRQAAVREKTRLLLLSSDQSILGDGSQTLDFYLSLASYFDEIHVIVIVPLQKSRRRIERVVDNVWLYTTAHAQAWQVGTVLRQLVEDQLTFTNGFQPDFIVATDPFVAGYYGSKLAKHYDRPFQIHVLTPFWLAAQASAKHNWWRLKLAHHVLKNAVSVRAGTREIFEYLQHSYKDIEDMAELPRQYDVLHLVSASDDKTDSNSDLLAEYSLPMLYIGVLDHKSTFFRALDAARIALGSPGVALIVIGDGPAKKEFQQRAKILGVSEKVIFKPAGTDIQPYLRNAQLLICTDTTEASEEIIIQAAANKMAIVAAKTTLRDDLFTDGQDAFLCEPTDVVDFTQKINKFMNASALRVQFGENAQNIVQHRLYEDPQAVRQAYSASLEAVFGTYYHDAEELAVGPAADGSI